MKYIKQTISGAKMTLLCDKCGERQVFEITNREATDAKIKVFIKDHKHPGKEK